MKSFKNILSILILLVLLLPAAQQYFKLAELEPLHGAYHLPDTVSPTLSHIASGEFQEKYSAYYEYQIGFRPFFIRLRNQLYFWFFQKSTNHIVIGNNNQLFPWDYWFAYVGQYSISEDTVNHRVELIKELSDSLKAKNKTFLCVIAPNKVRCMPEIIPREHASTPSSKTTYHKFLQAFGETDVPLLDLNDYFLKAIDTSRYPLFANTSVHWSGYGMNLGMKKMLEELERLSGKDIVNLEFEGWEMKDSTIVSDVDMSNLMNLLIPYQTEKLAFPVYKNLKEQQAQPARILIIGDSFFWNFYNFTIIWEVFDLKSRFWYYNNTQMDMEQKSTPISELSEHAAVDSADFVIIMATEINLYQFPYGFPEAYLYEYKE